MTVISNFFTLALVASIAFVTSSQITKQNDDTIHVLVYETDKKASRIDSLQGQIEGKVNGIDVTVFGEGDGFQGYGSKFSSVLPILKKMDKDALVVISDGRDVLLNNLYKVNTYSSILTDEFHMAFDELTFDHPGAIVISAEAQCCVSALTHAAPGSYFNVDGTRKQRACSSGQQNCLWNGDNKALPWEIFMKDLMVERTARDRNVYDDMYLNAGLMAGKAKDLLRVIESAQIGQDEDDQAVLTDYMFRHPNEIVLDYHQKIFGNNRGGVMSISKEARCTFNMSEEQNRLVHTKTGTTPLFIHSPGGFYECHDKLAQALGVPEVSQKERELTFGWFYQQQKKDCYKTTTSTYSGTNSNFYNHLRATPATDAPTSAPTAAKKSSSNGLLTLLLSRNKGRQLDTVPEPTQN